MPRTTATISGEQREAIYEFVLDRLGRLADLPLVIKQEDFETARRLAREFSGDFRLLEDLGWGADDRREVALTMSPEGLAEMLRRLHADADGALSGPPEEREAREAEEAVRRRDQLVLDTASGLLVELLVRGEEAAAGKTRANFDAAGTVLAVATTGAASGRLRCPTERRAPVLDATITIDREQRDGLYELIRNHLASVGDLFDALERDKDFLTAERLGLEFAEDFRLLGDIGWAEDDGRESFELTMRPQDLMEVLQRLQGEAGIVIAGAQGACAEAERNERFRRGYETCQGVLAGIDPEAGERALPASLEINPEERGALHRLLCRRLFVLGQDPPELARKEGVSLGELAEEFGEDLRLMGEIGWEFESDRDPVALRIPAESLVQTLERLRRDALRAPSEERHVLEPREADVARWQRFRRFVDVCEALLERLEPPGRDRNARSDQSDAEEQGGPA